LTTRQDLAKIKSRAMRTKVWFRALSRVERAILNLTIRCVERVQSRVLAGTISVIINKILQSLEEAFLQRAERIGRSIAETLCEICEKWGNKASLSWRRDKSFITFLGVTALNV